VKNWILWAEFWHLSIYEIFNMEPGVYKISVTSYWHKKYENKIIHWRPDVSRDAFVLTVCQTRDFMSQQLTEDLSPYIFQQRPPPPPPPHFGSHSQINSCQFKTIFNVFPKLLFGHWSFCPFFYTLFLHTFLPHCIYPLPYLLSYNLPLFISPPSVYMYFPCSFLPFLRCCFPFLFNQIFFFPLLILP
jgi:hypothetical protein